MFRNAVLLAVLCTLLFACTALGGGDLGDRTTTCQETPAAVDHDRIAFSDFGAVAGALSETDDVVILKDGAIVRATGVKCMSPFAFQGGESAGAVIGYDGLKRPTATRWSAPFGSSSARTTCLYNKSVRDPFRPSLYGSAGINVVTLVGGANCIVVIDPRKDNAPQVYNLPKYNVQAAAMTRGGIYFASDGMLYFLAANGRVEPTNIKAYDVGWGADRLYIVNNWGVMSLVVPSSGGRPVEEKYVFKGYGPCYFAGGNVQEAGIMTPYGVYIYGSPEGKG